jgi:RNA polymerase sigma-70 factor (ECF subfamily)
VSPDETRRILVRALDGSDEARGALLERVRPRLLLWLNARLSPSLRRELDPEDVAQDILLAAHRGLDGFRGEDDRQFFGWLFTLAENRIRDLADRYGAQKRQRAELPRKSETSPSVAAIRGEEAGRVREAVGRLPEEYRRVLQLRRFEEREVPEVARLMERSENAVRILYFRAIRALREEMDAGESRL